MGWKAVVAPLLVGSTLTIAGCIAAGGEAVTATSGGDQFSLIKILEIGGPWLFLAWLINHNRERDKKDEASRKRFEAIDKEMIATSKDATIAMQIMAVAANELRSDVKELKAAIDELRDALYTKPCLRPPDARTRETDRIHR